MTNDGFGIVKDEIYTVEMEAFCPVCGCRSYKLADIPSSFYTTMCVGDLNPSSGGFTELEPHHYWQALMISARFFRLVDYSFGEKIAQDIEIEEGKNTFIQYGNEDI